MRLFLLIVSVVSLIGWLMQYISTLTLVWYLTEKGFPLPSDADLKKGSRYVVSHLLKDRASDKH
jgi:hypothetical protein